ncbi:MAG: IS66 family insertion sequence element accessory protein TnpB [Clostridium sp.]|nr:IS66 family insertion sequence element accessory protein TnpB [Clostridium sp.]
MNTRKIAKEYRLSQWVQIINARSESGKSVKKFCEDAGISRYAYFYWQRKLHKKALSELTIAEESTKYIPDGWVKLNPEKPQYTNKGISIEVNGCHNNGPKIELKANC